MGHDDELRIREKIRNLDGPLAVWDKDLVWSSVRLNGTRPVRRIFVYYAAASLALAAAIVFYSIELTQRVALRARISELDLALEQLRSTGRPTETIQVASFAECPEATQAPVQTPRLAHRVNRIQPVMKAKDVTPVEHNAGTLQSTTVANPTESVAVISLSKESIAHPIIESTPQPASLVILGKSITSSPDHASLKKGRLQMRLFVGDDEVATGTSSTTPMTKLAGINNR